MPVTIFEARSLVTVERRPGKLYVARWQALCGPHYRNACNALLADARENGIETYVSDPHEARDVQTQQDLVFAATVVEELIALGCRRFVVVAPQSAVTKLATNRMGKVVDAKGVERVVVASLDEALAAAVAH